MATTASNYWTATAYQVMPSLFENMFDDETISTIEASYEVSSIITEYRLEQEEWDNHKFGLCHICKKGLDDKADVVFYNAHHLNCIICTECDERF